MTKKKPKESSRWTQRDEAFTQGLFKGLSQREAWREAGFSTNYAVEIIDKNACEKANSSKVKVRLSELQKKAEDDSVATVLERKQVLTEVIRGRVSQFTEGNRISVNADDLHSAAVAEVTTSEIKLGRGEDALTAEITKLKLRDPIAAISELNKMDGIYKSEGTGNTINNFNVNIDKVLIDARGKLESNLNSIAARTREAQALIESQRPGSPSTTV